MKAEEYLAKTAMDWITFWQWLITEAKQHGSVSGGVDAGMDLDGWLYNRRMEWVQSSKEKAN